MISRLLVVLSLCLLIPAGLAMAADATTCSVVAGDYILNMSGFAGGVPAFYPAGMIGKVTVDKDGVATGSYRLVVPSNLGGVQSSKSLGSTSKLTVAKACSGTLTFFDDAASKTAYTFQLYSTLDGKTLTLALADSGLILTGTATKQ